jgi:Tfp pilus assembly protein PilN
MIKVNLVSAGNKLDVSNIGGLDFTLVKFKAVLLVIFLLYVPDFTLVPYFQKEIENINGVIRSKQGQLNDLNKKLKKGREVEKQIQDLKAQELALKDKLIAVKQAISEKKNPADLLLYLAKNTPETLWITNLVIDKDQMVIKGEASDYKSIGDFVTNLRSSVFIKDANIVNTQSTVREIDKKRIESFEVKFQIARFDQ